jgi:hypothetical protein
MDVNMNNINLNERVLKTLKIAEKRGYNLTIDKLAVGLIGGEIDIDVLYEKIKNFDNIDFDGEFVATSGNLDTKKCKNRMNSNEKLQNSYLKIAQRYSLDFQRICPFIKCIMITGSTVTDGLTNDDDIDFNFIVQDNTKYTSYLLAILLSLK